MNIDDLLASLAPALRDGEFVFVTCSAASYGTHDELSPIGAYLEDEGLSLIVPRERAEAAGLSFDGVFRAITLTVHSSLAAVGLTAAVARALADRGIAANVVAAFHHDHVFVPAARADEALAALRAVAREAAR